MTTTFPFGRVRPIMLRVVIASLVVAAVVAIVSIATATFGETSWRLIATAVLFTAFALFSWYDADVSSKRSTPFALVSFAVSIYLFVAGMVKIGLRTGLPPTRTPTSRGRPSTASGAGSSSPRSPVSPCCTCTSCWPPARVSATRSCRS